MNFKILLITAVSAFIAGCTGLTTAYQVSDNVYKIGNSAEFSSRAEMEADTHRAAEEKCQTLGKKFVFLAEKSGNDGPIGAFTNNTRSYDLSFKCE